ncbi:MAG: ornithine carbamoyltransferase [Arenicellales bacterium]
MALTTFSPMAARHFLSLMDLKPDEIRSIVSRAIEMKKELEDGVTMDLLRHRTVAMVFEKSSTRTRVSFETGVTHLGGNAIFLAPSDSHLGRGEPIEDTARVLSRMASLIIMRTGSHNRVEKMAQFASIPVINGLSDFNHPCQQLADLQTWFEHRGEIEGSKVAWVGDGNNVCHSWMNAARLLEFQLVVATPPGYEPDQGLTRACQEFVMLTNNPAEAASGADLIVTDTWASMGQEQEKKQREANFAGFRVDAKLMSRASSKALFMHCLPAYRGVEVDAEIIDGPQSVVWDEAENRLHAQKALMEFLLTN